MQLFHKAFSLLGQFKVRYNRIQNGEMFYKCSYILSHGIFKARITQGTPENSHWREALLLQLLEQGFFFTPRTTCAPENPHWRKAIDM